MSTTNVPDLSHLTDRSAQVVQDAYRSGLKDGYQLGYSAAMKALFEAVKADPQSHLMDDVAQTDHSTQISATASSHSHGVGSLHVDAIQHTASGRAAPGSIKNMVRNFVLSAGTPVAEADFAAKYPDVLRPSRYMAFRTLSQEGVIVKENGKWVPASKGAAKPDNEASGHDNTMSNGGSNDM